jgi:hypothetical protein
LIIYGYLGIRTVYKQHVHDRAKPTDRHRQKVIFFFFRARSEQRICPQAMAVNLIAADYRRHEHGDLKSVMAIRANNAKFILP